MRSAVLLRNANGEPCWNPSSLIPPAESPRFSPSPSQVVAPNRPYPHSPNAAESAFGPIRTASTATTGGCMTPTTRLSRAHPPIPGATKYPSSHTHTHRAAPPLPPDAVDPRMRSIDQRTHSSRTPQQTLAPSEPLHVAGQNTGRVDRGASFRRDTRASRPNAEEVYDHLAEFLLDHDVAKAFINPASDGISLTAADPLPPAVSASSEENKYRHRKSLRYVAEERKKVLDGISTTAVDQSASNKIASVARKRSTKLWGSKIEEVTPRQIQGGGMPLVPESPTGAVPVRRKFLHRCCASHHLTLRLSRNYKVDQRRPDWEGNIRQSFPCPQCHDWRDACRETSRHASERRR